MRHIGRPERPRGATPLPDQIATVLKALHASREASPEQLTRLIMVRDTRWKYVHAEGFRPMLFDLQNDPAELEDLGGVERPDLDVVRARLSDAIFHWARRHHARITVTPERIEAMTGREPDGILIGFWDEAEYEKEFGKPFEDRP